MTTVWLSAALRSWADWFCDDLWFMDSWTLVLVQPLQDFEPNPWFGALQPKGILCAAQLEVQLSQNGTSNSPRGLGAGDGQDQQVGLEQGSFAAMVLACVLSGGTCVRTLEQVKGVRGARFRNPFSRCTHISPARCSWICLVGHSDLGQRRHRFYSGVQGNITS